MTSSGAGQAKVKGIGLGAVGEWCQNVQVV